MPTKIPPVTAEEILAAFAADDHVASANRIAKMVWEARGGTGGWGENRLYSEGPSPVPFVRSSNVQDVLAELVVEGVLVTAVGDDASRLGPMLGNSQPGARYFGLATVAEKWRAIEKRMHDTTAEAALALGQALDCIDVGGHRGVITVRLTTEQAQALAATLTMSQRNPGGAETSAPSATLQAGGPEE